MRGLVPRRRLQRLTVGLVAGGVVVSSLAFALTRATAEHDSLLLLRQDASQSSLVLSQLLTQAAPPVAGIEATVGPQGVDSSAWRAAATAAASSAGAQSLALVHVVGGTLDLVASTGTLHRSFGTTADAPFVAAIEGRRLPDYTTATTGGQHRVVQLVALPSLPGYALYSESVVPSVISLSSLPGQPFSHLQVAIYAGYESPADLIFGTTTRLPLLGERAVVVSPDSGAVTSAPAVVDNRVGRVSAPGRVLIVMMATANLTGLASELLPWLLLVVLLAATLVVAALLEMSGRRRRSAVAAAGELEKRNALLDRAIDEQRRTDARFAAVVRSSSDLTTVISANGTVLYQSPSSEHLLGTGPTTLVGTGFAELLHPNDLSRWNRTMAHVLAEGGGGRSAEWRLRTNDGGYVPVETKLTNLLDEPAVAGIVLNSRDVSERIRLEEELRHQAFHDSLTGLANRALFRDRLEHAVARMERAGGAVGLLFLDVDDFKAVNDGRGHASGDVLLELVGRRLEGAVRAGDTLARLGGDEFAVLLENGDAEGAEAAAAHILDALRAPFAVGEAEIVIGASIGVVTTSDPGVAPEELLRDADIAMYAAKSSGKGQGRLFHPGLRQDVVDRMHLENDLRHATDRGELAVVYQPIVDLEDGAVTGVEALMRWHHPRRGTVMPGEFIPVAESTGLIVEMGGWLLHKACRDVKLLEGQTGRFDLGLSVNLSARQLEDPGLADDVALALAESGLSPEQLTLEITESVFMADPQRSVVTLEHLKELGVRVAIDDFGTGYSSLAYLQRLPVDQLKIDRSFVAHQKSADASVLVETIVRLAGDLGLETVAEGVETEEQMQRLVRAGCHLAQGFLLARPTGLDLVRGSLTVSHLQPGAQPRYAGRTAGQASGWSAR